MKDIQKVREVLNAYSRFMTTLTGNKFIKARGFPQFGKTWWRCARVWDVCHKAGMSLADYFSIAHNRFKEDWLVTTFGRAYAPFPIQVSAKTTEFVMKSAPSQKGTGADRHEAYRKLLEEKYDAGILSDVVEATKGGGEEHEAVGPVGKERC